MGADATKRRLFVFLAEHLRKASDVAADYTQHPMPLLYNRLFVIGEFRSGIAAFFEVTTTTVKARSRS